MTFSGVVDFMLFLFWVLIDRVFACLGCLFSCCFCFLVSCCFCFCVVEGMSFHVVSVLTHVLFLGRVTNGAMRACTPT